MIFAIGKRSKIALGARPGSAVSINYETIEKSLEMLLFWQMAWCGENSSNKTYLGATAGSPDGRSRSGKCYKQHVSMILNGEMPTIFLVAKSWPYISMIEINLLLQPLLTSLIICLEKAFCPAKALRINALPWVIFLEHPNFV